MKHLYSSEDNNVHFESVDGNDYLFCGLAYEGTDGQAELIETKAPVDCSDCIKIVLAAKKIKRNEYYVK